MDIETLTNGLKEAISAKRAELEAMKAKGLELNNLEASLKALQRTSVERNGAKLAQPRQQQAGPGIRIFVLGILKDHRNKPMMPKEIVDALQAKGYQGERQAITNNLGATLSVMCKTRKEVKRAAAGGYLISAKGLKTLEGATPTA